MLSLHGMHRPMSSTESRKIIGMGKIFSPVLAYVVFCLVQK